MIVKILNSAGNDFSAIQYNDKKISSEKGDLMSIKNFPSWLSLDSSKEEFKNYFQSITEDSDSKTLKPQFHATISTKGVEHSKEELNKIGSDFMGEIGYGNQPYMIIFHNDTENNHIHIVSTRIDVETNKLKRNSFEKLQANIALNKIMNNNYSMAISKILEQYKFNNINQLKLIFEAQGFKVDERDNELRIIKNGISEANINKDSISYSKVSKKDLDRNERINQIKAFTNKYSNVYNTNLFQVRDNRDKEGRCRSKDEPDNSKTKYDIQSEFQHKMKLQFGLEFIFHNSDNKKPYGFTVIDNNTKQVFKGSEILKMDDFFKWTPDVLDKKTFEHLKKLNTNSEEKQKAIKEYYLNSGILLKDHMFFSNRDTKNDKYFNAFKKDVTNFLIGKKNSNMNTVTKIGSESYVLNLKYNMIYKLSDVVDMKEINALIKLNENQNEIVHLQQEESVLDDVINELKKDDSSALQQNNRRKRGYLDDYYTR